MDRAVGNQQHISSQKVETENTSNNQISKLGNSTRNNHTFTASVDSKHSTQHSSPELSHSCCC